MSAVQIDPVAAAVAGTGPISISPVPTISGQTVAAERIRVADASNNKGLLGGLLSLFKKKPKHRPARRIIIQNNRQGVIIQRRRPAGRIVVKPGGGRRIFNRYIPNAPGVARTEARTRSFRVHRRTMCVRLCDGFYWPMRSNGSNNSLQRDAQTCESSCKSASRLFVLNTSTDNITRMRDLGGRSYGKLKNAFKYRKSFNPSCRCKPEAWSERAQLRHKRYAAVGKERQILAMRSVALDLRRTLKPTVETTRVAGKRVTGAEFWDPTLPVRKPLGVAFVDKHAPGTSTPILSPKVNVAGADGVALPALRLRSAIAVVPTAQVTTIPVRKLHSGAVPGLRSRYSARRADRFGLSGQARSFRSRAGIRGGDSFVSRRRNLRTGHQSVRPDARAAQSIFRARLVPFAVTGTPVAASRRKTH